MNTLPFQILDDVDDDIAMDMFVYWIASQF